MKLHELTALSESSLVLSSSFLAQLSLGKFFCNGYCTDMQSIKWLGLHRGSSFIRPACFPYGRLSYADMQRSEQMLHALLCLLLLALEYEWLKQKNAGRGGAAAQKEE